MVRRALIRCVSAAEFEPVAVAIEGGETPSTKSAALPLTREQVAAYRLYPFPQEIVSSIVTADLNSHRSSPSSTLFHSLAPLRRLPSPEPSLQANPSALSPFLRGSLLP